MSETIGLLRPGLLAGVSILVAGAAEPAGFGIAVSAACRELGACVGVCAPDADEEAVVEEIVTAAVAETGSLDLLVVDGAGLFAQGPARGNEAAVQGGARAALGACLDVTWNVTRAVANMAFLPQERGGRILFIAPAHDAGRHAEAACAGLENLARTLSIEWARHAIAPVTIAPGEGATAGEVAALCAYLASPAGAYFSGCLLDLRGP